MSATPVGHYTHNPYGHRGASTRTPVNQQSCADPSGYSASSITSSPFAATNGRASANSVRYGGGPNGCSPSPMKGTPLSNVHGGRGGSYQHQHQQHPNNNTNHNMHQQQQQAHGSHQQTNGNGYGYHRGSGNGHTAGGGASPTATPTLRATVGDADIRGEVDVYGASNGGTPSIVPFPEPTASSAAAAAMYFTSNNSNSTPVNNNVATTNSSGVAMAHYSMGGYQLQAQPCGTPSSRGGQMNVPPPHHASLAAGGISLPLPISSAMLSPAGTPSGRGLSIAQQQQQCGTSNHSGAPAPPLRLGNERQQQLQHSPSASGLPLCYADGRWGSPATNNNTTVAYASNQQQHSNEDAGGSFSYCPGGGGAGGLYSNQTTRPHTAETCAYLNTSSLCDETDAGGGGGGAEEHHNSSGNARAGGGCGSSSGNVHGGQSAFRSVGVGSVRVGGHPPPPPTAALPPHAMGRDSAPPTHRAEGSGSPAQVVVGASTNGCGPHQQPSNNNTPHYNGGNNGANGVQQLQGNSNARPAMHGLPRNGSTGSFSQGWQQPQQQQRRNQQQNQQQQHYHYDCAALPNSNRASPANNANNNNTNANNTRSSSGANHHCAPVRMSTPTNSNANTANGGDGGPNNGFQRLSSFHSSSFNNTANNNNGMQQQHSSTGGFDASFSLPATPSKPPQQQQQGSHHYHHGMQQHNSQRPPLALGRGVVVPSSCSPSARSKGPSPIAAVGAANANTAAVGGDVARPLSPSSPQFRRHPQHYHQQADGSSVSGGGASSPSSPSSAFSKPFYSPVGASPPSAGDDRAYTTSMGATTTCSGATMASITSAAVAAAHHYTNNAANQRSPNVNVRTIAMGATPNSNARAVSPSVPVYHHTASSSRQTPTAASSGSRGATPTTTNTMHTTMATPTTQQQQAYVETPESLAKRVEQREKQVRIGKCTIGYERYCAMVPMGEREEGNPLHPVTPRTEGRLPKRAFDRVVRDWRKALHWYDPSEARSVTGADAGGDYDDYDSGVDDDADSVRADGGDSVSKGARTRGVHA